MNKLEVANLLSKSSEVISDQERTINELNHEVGVHQSYLKLMLALNGDNRLMGRDSSERKLQYQLREASEILASDYYAEQPMVSKVNVKIQVRPGSGPDELKASMDEHYKKNPDPIQFPQFKDLGNTSETDPTSRTGAVL